MKIFKTLLIILAVSVSTFGFSQNNITITDNASHNADASAMLDVYSTSKGMLVPRMTTLQTGMISSPATGLLVFNTDVNSFWFYNGANWQNLSDPGTDIWGINQSTGDVYLTDLMTNIGIGTDEPLSKLAVVANTDADPDAPLFEILDEFGKPIFSVTSEGVRIYVKDVDSKGISGGFAVGKYGAAKGFPDTTFFMVTPDSTRVYTQASEKGISGGFAVGKYGAAKGVAENYLHLTENNYFIGHKAGESMDGGLYNTFYGFEAGINTITGSQNVFVGYKSGHSNTTGEGNIYLGNSAGYSNMSTGKNIAIGDSASFFQNGGWGNTVIGYRAGYDGVLYNNNTYIGSGAGKFNPNSNNTFIGNAAGGSSLCTGGDNVFVGLTVGVYSQGDQNVFLGNYSGLYSVGNENVYLGHCAGRGTSSIHSGSGNVLIGDSAGYYNDEDNRLYIENSNSSTPLIYGEFDNRIITVNGSLGISTTPSEKLEISGGNVYVSGGDFYASNMNGVINCGGGIMSSLANVISDGVLNNAYATGDEELYIYGDLEVDGEAYKIGTSSWTIQSDKRLKKDISDYNDGIEQIMEINPVYFRYNEKAGVSSDRLYVGVIAQDIKDVAPYTVELTPFNKIEIENEEGKVVNVKWDGTEYYTFNPSALTFMLINGVKEQQNIINNQESRIKKLEEDNNELKEEMDSLRKLIENK